MPPMPPMQLRQQRLRLQTFVDEIALFGHHKRLPGYYAPMSRYLSRDFAASLAASNLIRVLPRTSKAYITTMSLQNASTSQTTAVSTQTQKNKTSHESGGSKAVSGTTLKSLPQTPSIRVYDYDSGTTTIPDMSSKGDSASVRESRERGLFGGLPFPFAKEQHSGRDSSSNGNWKVERPSSGNGRIGSGEGNHG